MKFKEEVIRTPLCENCGTEIKFGDPYYAEGLDYYCGNCAFKLGKITKEEYIKKFLYFVPFGSIKDVIIENNKVKVI